MNQTTKAGRRRFIVQSGTVVAAAALATRRKHPAAAQDAIPERATPSSSAASPAPEANETRLRFTAGDTEIMVRLADNPTSRDFVSLLPLELEFADFNRMEKISDLPRPLTTEGSIGTTPANRNLINLVPWGNLGFFYDAARRDPSFDDRVILNGTVVAGVDLLNDLERGPVRVDLTP